MTPEQKNIIERALKVMTPEQKNIIERALSTLIWETKKNILDTQYILDTEQQRQDDATAGKQFLVEQRKLFEDATLLRKELRENLWNPVR